MRVAGSTLLFPSDSKVRFELKEFDGCVIGSLAQPKSFVLVFRAHSALSKTLRAPCSVMGKCMLTKACVKEMTNNHLPRKEQRKIGLACYSQMDWPDVNAFLTCPVCGVKNTVGGPYYMIFYSMAQLQTTALPFGLAGRRAVRLMCMGCMHYISRNQVPTNTEIVLGPGVWVQEYLEATSVTSFFRNGLFAKVHETLTARRLYYAWMESPELSASVEKALVDEIGLLVKSLHEEMAGGMKHAEMPGRRELKKQAKAKVETGLCLVCKKENSNNVCVICKRAVYCGKDCQRKDWKRHKIVECVPPTTPFDSTGPCFVCKKENSKSICSICKRAVYCGKDCQRKDWKRHKIVDCVPPRAPFGSTS
jgi:hypothetical protein